MDEARQITMAFSEFTGQLSKQVRFKYYVPQELQEMRQVTDKRKMSPRRSDCVMGGWIMCTNRDPV